MHKKKHAFLIISAVFLAIVIISHTVIKYKQTHNILKNPTGKIPPGATQIIKIRPGAVQYHYQGKDYLIRTVPGRENQDGTIHEMRSPAERKTYADKAAKEAADLARTLEEHKSQPPVEKPTVQK